MTAIEKKNHLSQYRLIQAKINRITEMLKNFPEEADKLNKQLFAARQMRDRIEFEIEAMGGGLLTEILSQKYLCGHTFEEIGENLNYSARHIERLHRRALEELVIC